MHQPVSSNRILVVDDTKVNLDILVDTLKDDYVLSVATSGQRALQQAKLYVPDLVLLDVMMPGMDGFEVCRKLKENPETRDVPVIFITALAESQAVVKGLESGAVDYITKPIDPPEVRARVSTHLNLLRARQDLERQTEELEASNKRLRELDDIKSSFLSSVAHELRTPLTSILGFAILVRKDFQKHFGKLTKADKALEEKALRIQDNLTVINSEGQRLSRMINDVLDLTKIESGRIEWSNQPFTVEPMIRLATQAVSSLLTGNPAVELKVEMDDNLPRLCADRDRIQQVLINLLHNAVKFTRQGSILLKAEVVKSGMVRLSVRDTGIGIPKVELEKIFNKFHQVITDDTLLPNHAKGTGLGLPICKQIVEHYGGRIWAESVLGKGSVLSFELPPHQEETGPRTS